jgi:arylsulfatase A-like enzyme
MVHYSQTAQTSPDGPGAFAQAPGSLWNHYRATLAAFALCGTMDWAMASLSAPPLTLPGLLAGWLVIVALWVTAGGVWAVVTSLLTWLATGHYSSEGLVACLADRARLWWRERHDDIDARRLGTFIALLTASGAWALASIALTAYLIAERNGPYVIAGAAFIGQLLLAIVLGLVALTLRRAIIAVVRFCRPYRWLGWLHTPFFVAVAIVIGATVAIAGLRAGWQTFLAVEGPAIGLFALAIILQPLIAWSFGRRLFPHVALRHASWLVPALALFVVGVVSQHPEARRLVVLHGETSNFAFNALQRYVGLDRLFDRSDCPPLGPDGQPADGLSREEFEARCFDPSYDRPVAREQAPPYERPEFEQPPSFLFITWDSVRTDRLSFMGHERTTTPNVDAFAARSLVFDRAFAADSGTGPSFWSLMAGKTPFQVALTDGERFPPTIEPSERMLGEVLDEAGYRNEAVMCGSVFDNRTWGIRRGFHAWANVCGRKRHFLAPYVVDAANSALDRLGKEKEPFFLWVHFYDPHIPYTNHPDLDWGDERTDYYDEELHYTDAHMQKVLEVAHALQDKRPLYIIFGADHGEGFGEHGTDPHARNLYRVVTQVPFIIHGPGVVPRRISPPVALNDVYPTVLDLANVAIPSESTMVSQVPVLFGAAPDLQRMVFQENSYSRPRRHTRAVVYDRYHYIMDLTTNTHELYDYVTDPLERRNLIGTHLIEERIMRQALLRFLATSQIPEGMLN